jgi:peptidoglycan/xylan/chitin deacetylase (PgdA/CDA1 family)
VLRVRVTRFHLVVATALALGAVILVLTDGALRWLCLSVLCTATGLGIGLGVSFPQWQMFGESLCRVRTSRRAVALTFDDGPDPQSTPVLLRLLAQRGVRATFFCIGERVARHPDLARRIVAEGHAIENHAHRHDPWTNLFSAAQLRAELSAAQKEIQRLTGRAPAFYRPPMGLTNQRVFRVARELGLRVTGYTARGRDTRPATTEQVLARLARGIVPGGILLLHDGGVSTERLVAIVTRLLDRLEADGFQCLRLDELPASETSA